MEKLNFSDIMDQVERREYVFKNPTWITKLVKKKEKPGQGADGGGQVCIFDICGQYF